MEYAQFEELIRQIKQPYDQQLRNMASERYFYYLDAHKEDFAQNMLALFYQVEDRELLYFAAIILRKEVTLRNLHSCIYSVPVEVSGTLLGVILQRLAQADRDLARVLGDLAGELSSHLLYCRELVHAFAQQAFNGGEVAQTEAAHIVSVISNSSVQNLPVFGMQELLSYIQKALEAPFYQANVYGIYAIQTILINYYFANQEHDTIPAYLYRELFYAVLHKMQQMSNDLPQSRKFFLKSLELFSELLDLCADLVNEHLAIIIQLIENLLQSGVSGVSGANCAYGASAAVCAQDEDLFKLGANFMASICDTGELGYIDFQPEHYTFLTQLTCQFLLRVYLCIPDAHAQDYCTVYDPSDLYDRNSLPEIVYDALQRIFGGKFLEVGMPAFQQFAQLKNDAWQYKYALLKIIDVLITCQNFQATSSLPGLLKVIMQNFYDAHPMATFQAEACLRHAIDYNNSNFHLLEQISAEAQQFLPRLFENEYDFIKIGAMDVLSALLETLKPYSVARMQTLCVNVIRTFCTSQNVILRAGAVEVFNLLIRKGEPETLFYVLGHEMEYFLCQFYSIAYGLSAYLRKSEIRYFSALTMAVAYIITIYYQQFYQPAERIVQLFILLLKTPIVEEIHYFTDVLIQALAEATRCYVQLISEEDLKLLLRIFINIIYTPLFSEGKEQLLSEAGPSFNTHIRQYQTSVYRALSTLFRCAPARLAEYSEALLDSFYQKAAYTTYSFTDIAEICFLIPRGLRTRGVGAVQIQQYIQKLIQLSILPDDVHRCSEEVEKIMGALALFANDVTCWASGASSAAPGTETANFGNQSSMLGSGSTHNQQGTPNAHSASASAASPANYAGQQMYNNMTPITGPECAVFVQYIIYSVVALLQKTLTSFKDWVDELEFDSLTSAERAEYAQDEMRHLVQTAQYVHQIVSGLLQIDGGLCDMLLGLSDQIQQKGEIAAVFVLPLYDCAQLRERLRERYAPALLQRLATAKYHLPLDARLAALFLLDTPAFAPYFASAAAVLTDLNVECQSQETATFLLLLRVEEGDSATAAALFTQLQAQKCESLVYLRVLAYILGRPAVASFEAQIALAAANLRGILGPLHTDVETQLAAVLRPRAALLAAQTEQLLKPAAEYLSRIIG